MKASVSVIIPAVTKYEHFVRDALESVKYQLEEDVQPVVVPADGMTVGAAMNVGAHMSQGPFLMRLDADDWLEPACCLVLASCLRTDPGLSAAYSDFWLSGGGEKEVGRQGVIPHPACMLIRRSVFNTLGGFDESLAHQDGADFWLRFMGKGHRARHLTAPLWYYRQHDAQMSRAHNAKVRAAHEIKDQHMQPSPRILCVIPARGGSKGVPRKNLVRLDGVPLVARAIRTAKACRHNLLIVVSTEDEEIAEVARAEGVDVLDRPAELSGDEVSLVPVARHAMIEMEDWRADIVVTLPPTSPLLKPEHIDAALDIAESPEVDSVVAVSEVHRHPYRTYRLLSNARLEPYFPEESERYLQRQDRPPAYGFSGLYVRKRKLLEAWDGKDFALSRCYGVIVEQSAGVDIDSRLDLWLAEAIIKQGAE